MAVEQHFESIAKLLQNIITGRKESTDYYKRLCEIEHMKLIEIKQKFDENEKRIKSLERKTENMSTGEFVAVKTDSTTSTIHKTRDGEHVQENKPVVANIIQLEDGDDSIKSDVLKSSLSQECDELKRKVSDLEQQIQRSTKSASKHEPDLVKEQQLKADKDELEKKLNRLATINMRLEENLQREKEENITRNRRIDELTNRLSALAAHQLTKDNPQIADLSDQCRPTKLAEGFSQIYDNKWTDVFEIFAKKKIAERDIVDMLTHTINVMKNP
ncbi:hypothetical protein DPMN_148779 [Dreissena polymorpha]|uniref:Uncharacterized protein n=1 Tax=Dreissena polymorpha TaxID=45954 RepID=A0A9D4J0K0_DREPO|nr:hypothetical protein DPMN_148779 [Dreissena polymorpha]